MIIDNGSPKVSLNEVVLFPFDDFSIPFTDGLRLHLLQKNNAGFAREIVLKTGDPGSPDSRLVVYYGTVRKVGDELWMWYLGQGEENIWHQRVCLAKSKDGYNWERPKLGLVDYQGSRDNNLVDLLGGGHVQSCVVFYDPDDPDPNRKFKMAFQSRIYKNAMAVAFSEDGLRWTESTQNPVGYGFEIGGGAKLNGCYHLSGQGFNSHFPQSRQLEIRASYDFENWTKSSCLGYRRDGVPPRPNLHDYHELYNEVHAGEQIHLGTSLWDRGNVLIGIYGMWHGHPSNDRRLVTMDLGLVITNDALHYREPLPDLRIVPAAEDNWTEEVTWTNYGQPADSSLPVTALMQGQGFENIGDESLYWYTPWPEHLSVGIRVAAWPRDRLGYFSPFKMKGNKFRGKDLDQYHFISAPIDLEGEPARVAMNIDGLSEHSKVSVEIQNERFEPIPGYTAEDCTEPIESGLRKEVRWGEQEVLGGMKGPVRIRVNFEGIRPEDVKLFAIYLTKKTN